MEGTIRAFDPNIRKQIHERTKKTATTIAEGAGATAEVQIFLGTPVTVNNPQLTAQMTPTLQRTVGRERVMTPTQQTGAEDFAFYQEKIPGMFFFLGITPPGAKPVPNHSPYFYVDESALVVGVRAMSSLAVDFLESKK
jgi:metal-dependent amidase/aminoacylase/carboxypeptidase family protein